MVQVDAVAGRRRKCAGGKRVAGERKHNVNASFHTALGSSRTLVPGIVCCSRVAPAAAFLVGLRLVVYGDTGVSAVSDARLPLHYVSLGGAVSTWHLRPLCSRRGCKREIPRHGLCMYEQPNSSNTFSSHKHKVFTLVLRCSYFAGSRLPASSYPLPRCRGGCLSPPHRKRIVEEFARSLGPLLFRVRLAHGHSGLHQVGHL